MPRSTQASWLTATKHHMMWKPKSSAYMILMICDVLLSWLGSWNFLSIGSFDNFKNS